MSTSVTRAMFVCVVACALPVLAHAQRGERYALLAAVRNYSANSGLRDLRYSERDVLEMAGVLQSAGYRRENVIIMTQTRGAEDTRFLPMKANIIKELQALLRDLGPTDAVMVGFAGHGVQFRDEETSYFCPVDAKLDQRDTLVSLAEVYAALNKSGAGVRLLLADACRDDPFDKNTRRAEVDLESVTRPRLAAPPGGVAALFSCSEGEVARESDELRQGVFFHFAIQGLTGQADNDFDGRVDLLELANFSQREVKDYVRFNYDGARQLPHFMNNTRGVVPLVDTGRRGLKTEAERVAAVTAKLLRARQADGVAVGGFPADPRLAASGGTAIALALKAAFEKLNIAVTRRAEFALAGRYVLADDPLHGAMVSVRCDLTNEAGRVVLSEEMRVGDPQDIARLAAPNGSLMPDPIRPKPPRGASTAARIVAALRGAGVNTINLDAGMANLPVEVARGFSAELRELGVDVNGGDGPALTLRASRSASGDETIALVGGKPTLYWQLRRGDELVDIFAVTDPEEYNHWASLGGGKRRVLAPGPALLNRVRNPSFFIDGTKVRPAADSKYAVEVLLNRDGALAALRPRDDDGVPFVDIPRGVPYVIRVTNRSPHAASVWTSIDGLNVFQFNEESTSFEKFIFAPNVEQLIHGWFRTYQVSDAFEVTAYAKSARAQVLPGAPTPEVGTISVVFAAAWKGTSDRPLDEPLLAETMAAVLPPPRTKELEMEVEIAPGERVKVVPVMKTEVRETPVEAAPEAARTPDAEVTSESGESTEIKQFMARVDDPPKDAKAPDATGRGRKVDTEYTKTGVEHTVGVPRAVVTIRYSK